MTSKNKTLPLILGACLAVILGVGSAWLIYSNFISKSVTANVEAVPGAKKTSDSAGLLDDKLKYDNAIGVLKEGGMGHEGTHRLEREGGPGKNVYLTSSIVELGGFTGKKVQVWGQTLSSKSAGWLLDVAKIQVVN